MGERARDTTATDGGDLAGGWTEDAAPERIDASDVALVLEGGGMRNSYTAPCIEMLLRHGVDVGWVGGISAGATLTANYLSGSIARARATFTTMTDTPEFGGWGNFLRGRGYFNAEWIYEKSPMVATAGVGSRKLAGLGVAAGSGSLAYLGAMLKIAGGAAIAALSLAALVASL